MFCAQCGRPILDGSRYCNYCGAAAPTEATDGEPGAAETGPGGSSGGTESPAAAAPGPPPPPHGALLRRVRNILLSPSTEWPVIAAEPVSTRALYLGYAAPLIAIGVVSTFIGHSLVGLPLVGRVAVGAALAHALLSYALSFLGLFLIALIVDLLAPNFGGRRDALAALKVTVYSFTPGWVAGIFNLIPVLSVLAIVGGLYGLYLLYVGLPVLMRCPPDKSVGYTILAVIGAIVTWAVIAALSACIVGGLA